MDNSFRNLGTERFRLKMRPCAELIYHDLFPGCRVDDLRKDGLAVHVLDKEFGIDTLVTMPSGQWLSVQEKYRRNKYLSERQLMIRPPYPDFTQEYKNAAGTEHEADGEWFRLGAQVYFYGWANERENGFEKWVLIDIAQYKLLVEENGGIERFGVLKRNRAHGRASFYAIPVNRLQPAWLATHRGRHVSVEALRAVLRRQPAPIIQRTLFDRG